MKRLLPDYLADIAKLETKKAEAEATIKGASGGDEEEAEEAVAIAAPVKACVATAVAASVHAKNNARLTGVYDSRNGVKALSVAALR